MADGSMVLQVRASRSAAGERKRGGEDLRRLIFGLRQKYFSLSYHFFMFVVKSSVQYKV